MKFPATPFGLAGFASEPKTAQNGYNFFEWRVGESETWELA